MIKSKAAILKGLGDWIYDEIEIPEPDKSRAIIRIIKSGICSTDVVDQWNLVSILIRLYLVTKC